MADCSTACLHERRLEELLTMQISIFQEEHQV